MKIRRCRRPWRGTRRRRPSAPSCRASWPASVSNRSRGDLRSSVGTLKCTRHRCIPEPLQTVDRQLVASSLLTLTDKRGPGASNRTRASLSSFFGWAGKEGLLDANPATFTHKAIEGGARKRVLSDDGLKRIWNALEDDAYGAITRLLILTGARRDEIGALAWSEVDLEAALIRLPGDRTKSRQEHLNFVVGTGTRHLAAWPRRAIWCSPPPEPALLIGRSTRPSSTPVFRCHLRRGCYTTSAAPSALRCTNVSGAATRRRGAARPRQRAQVRCRRGLQSRCLSRRAHPRAAAMGCAHQRCRFWRANKQGRDSRISGPLTAVHAAKWALTVATDAAVTKARKSNRKAAPRPPADVEMADVLFQATLRQYAPLTAEDIRGLTVPEIRQLWLQRHERSETSGGRPTKLTPPSPPPRPKTQPQRPKQRPNPSRPQSRLRPPLEEPPLKKWLFDAVVRYPQSAKESRSAYARRLRDNSPPHLKKLDWETFRNNLYTL